MGSAFVSVNAERRRRSGSRTIVDSDSPHPLLSFIHRFGGGETNDSEMYIIT